MNFLHKKIWIAWSKLRFLRLPIDKRVRLEATTDGRHLTFILVSLYEAGYGVQVVGSPAVFRELICLKKSAPIPFVIGGGEMECGISISDKSGFNHGGHGEHGGGKRVLLDYDYFSGLMERVEAHPGGWAAARETAVRQPEGRDERERTSQITRVEAEQVGLRLASQANAEFSNPFTSELAQDSENTSPTRSANGPASSAEQPRTDIGGLISDKSEVAKALDSGRSAIDSDRRPNAGHSLKEWSGVFEELSPSSLGSMPSKTPPAWAPGVPALASSSVLIRDIRGQNASSPATSHSPLATALRAPYFMHPSIYHRGLHKGRSPDTALDTRHSPPVTRHSAAGASHPLPATSYWPQRRRRFRIGFFGTHDRDFYTKHYHFPGMNRFEILEAFFEKFGDSFVNLEGPPQDWKAAQIAVSIDTRGGDRRGKTFLSQDHYLEALRECDFVLSPPGWCMPISHNLIEAMFCGSIPITNGGAYMAEPLKDGETCLEFQDAESLVSVIDRAMAMDADEVALMRLAVWDYYERFLEPKAFVETLVHSESARVLVNAEENSVPLVFAGIIFPWDVPTEAPGRGEEVSGANL